MPSETTHTDHDNSGTSELNQSSSHNPDARNQKLTDAPSAIANQTGDEDDATAKNELITCLENLGPKAFAVMVTGESMLPDFSPGDYIVVDPSVKPTPGRFVIAKLDKDDAATFKKYLPLDVDNSDSKIIELASLNPDWPSIYLSAVNPGRIIGTVVGHQRAV